VNTYTVLERNRTLLDTMITFFSNRQQVMRVKMLSRDNLWNINAIPHPRNNSAYGTRVRKRREGEVFFEGRANPFVLDGRRAFKLDRAEFLG